MNDMIDWDRSDRVYQAQGMVALQANCTVDEALTKMAEEAQASHMSVEAIATAVVERRMRFGSAAQKNDPLE